MNLVMDEASEVYLKTQGSKPIGQFLAVSEFSER